MREKLLAMSKGLIARAAGDAIRSGPNGPATSALRRAAAMAEVAIRVLETEDISAGKARLIEAIECYLEAHACRVSRSEIARELEEELRRQSCDRSLTSYGRPPWG